MGVLLKLDSSTTKQNSQNFTIQYPGGLTLNTDPNRTKTYEVALITANLWYSWHNIDADFSNNTLRYYNGSTWKNVTIPDGIYDISAINDYLHQEMKANGDSTTNAAGEDIFDIEIVPNFNTLRCKVEISNSYQLDLSVSSLNSLLGFASKIVTATEEGTNGVDITRGVNSLVIHCSIVTGSYENSTGSDVLYTFVPRSSPGSNIEVSPNYPIYLPLSESRQIMSINMRITDQQGRLINFNGENVTYVIHIREASD